MEISASFGMTGASGTTISCGFCISGFGSMCSTGPWLACWIGPGLGLERVWRVRRVLLPAAMHRRPGAWARPIGGPFSDWHGPVLSESTDLTPAAFLRGVGLLGMSAFGWMPQDAASETRLAISGANITDVGQDWSAFLEEQTRRWPKHFKKMGELDD